MSHKAWKVAIGRLRQPGFPHRAIITTTPQPRPHIVELVNHPKACVVGGTTYDIIQALRWAGGLENDS